MRFWEANFDDLLTDKASNKLAYDYWREKFYERVKDPRKRKLLAPEKQLHPIFTKRPSLEQKYYDVLNQDNVDESMAMGCKVKKSQITIVRVIRVYCLRSQTIN